jgi:dephospho-CoA kinase
VIERDKSERETIEKIISVQMSMDEKIKRADYIIENNGSLEALKEETSKFFDLYFLR